MKYFVTSLCLLTLPPTSPPTRSIPSLPANSSSCSGDGSIPSQEQKPSRRSGLFFFFPPRITECQGQKEPWRSLSSASLGKLLQNQAWRGTADLFGVTAEPE